MRFLDNPDEFGYMDTKYDIFRKVVSKFFKSAAKINKNWITPEDIRSLAASMAFTEDLTPSLSLLDEGKISSMEFFNWWRCDRSKPESAALKRLLGEKCLSAGWMNRIGYADRRMFVDVPDATPAQREINAHITSATPVEQVGISASARVTTATCPEIDEVKAIAGVENDPILLALCFKANGNAEDAKDKLT